MTRQYLFGLFTLLACASVCSANHPKRASYPPQNTTQKTIKPEQNTITVESIEREKIHPQMSATHSSNSSNWCGYVAGPDLTTGSDGTVTAVYGEWTVPQLKATHDSTYSAIWVGIDGFLNSTVEQTGTSHSWVHGKQQNYVWFEMYPGGSYQIQGMPCNAGDLFSASVVYVGEGVFEMTITNVTHNVSYTVPTSYTTSLSANRSTAEWVVEAPYSGHILPLADFARASLQGCSATINSINGGIDNGAWVSDVITMENSPTRIKAVPSALQNSGASFTVTWEHE